MKIGVIRADPQIRLIKLKNPTIKLSEVFIINNTAEKISTLKAIITFLFQVSDVLEDGFKIISFSVTLLVFIM